jgi:hypothetical protein
MFRLLPILLALFVAACNSINPRQIHVVGTIREISRGYCGALCIGGLIKVDLEQALPNYNHKSVYLITACLSSDTKTGSKVDVIATLYTGDEEECYYRSFSRPNIKKDVVLYKLSETETAKVD